MLNQTADNVSDNYIYFSHIGGNSRVIIWNDISADVINVRFTNSSGLNFDAVLSYDMSQDYGTPTHYVLAFDRSADLTLYKNGNSVATVSISSYSTINIGAGNANVSRIVSGTNYGALGTFYRFRAFNTLADAKLLFERADVPQTLTANLLYDLDLAFANPTQSLTVQDRKGNSDGTASSNTLVTQVQPVVQLNATSARIGTSAGTPADRELLLDKFLTFTDNGGTITSANTTGELTIAGGNATNNGGNISLRGGSHGTPNTIRMRVGGTTAMTVDSTGEVKVFGSGSTGATLRL